MIILVFAFSRTGRRSQSLKSPQTPAQTSQTTAPTVSENPAAQCHLVNQVLPDMNCTPGVADPNVTEDNIQQTICVQGYTKTIRPPESYTTTLKRQQIAEYGYSDTNLRDYEEDHLISLELGGSPTDPKNLWPEPGASPNSKDKVEDSLHTFVCEGRIQLTDAQHRIASNWTTALNGL